MKFIKKKYLDNIPTGGDIPDDLIDKVFEGKVTVLSGAGVSMRIGFPSFKCLTTQIYDEVGESLKDENSENIAFKNKEYDRVLGLLEKRICFLKDHQSSAILSPNYYQQLHYYLQVTMKCLEVMKI